jgi:hypothetical protein
MEVTPFPMVTEVREMHRTNVRSLIEATPFPMLAVTRALHQENAPFPIEVTLSGMVTDARPEL